MKSKLVFLQYVKDLNAFLIFFSKNARTVNTIPIVDTFTELTLLMHLLDQVLYSKETLKKLN